MRHNDELERRLLDWAEVYGGGRYGLNENIKSPLGQMMKWGGRPPTGLGQSVLTPEADKVNDAVTALERQEHGWVPAQVLQCVYFNPGKPVESHLQMLARVCGRMDRVRYYQHLRTARQHVAAWCHLSFSDEAEQIEMAEGLV